jgi:hypothetical protein
MNPCVSQGCAEKVFESPSDTLVNHTQGDGGYAAVLRYHGFRQPCGLGGRLVMTIGQRSGSIFSVGGRRLYAAEFFVGRR